MCCHTYGWTVRCSEYGVMNAFTMGPSTRTRVKFTALQPSTRHSRLALYQTVLDTISKVMIYRKINYRYTIAKYRYIVFRCIGKSNIEWTVSEIHVRCVGIWILLYIAPDTSEYPIFDMSYQMGFSLHPLASRCLLRWYWAKAAINRISRTNIEIVQALYCLSASCIITLYSRSISITSIHIS